MVDDRVASAVAHWKPRFTTNGVVPLDFERIVGGLEVWDDWCRAWCDGAAVHEALGREALAAGRNRSAGAHLAQAAVYFHFAKFVFVDDLDQMRSAHESAVRCLNDALPHLDPPGERHEIPFEGSTLVGILRKPSPGGDHAAVILVPGLDSTKEELRSTEALFLERGLATFAVDGPGQGEAEYDLAIRGDWEVPGAALYEYLSSQPGIDAGRIGVWGVSLGGYYAPRVASGVQQIKACVALAGPYDFGAIWEGLPELTRNTYRVRSKTPDETAAREHAGTLSLAGRTESITCPLQVVMGKLDRIIPWQQAQRVVEEVGRNAEFLLLEDGNHGLANIAYKHRYRSADWMAAQLAGA
ncbi:MAG: prolyl oligopeptidase family serine peptidase [Actinobacteria bacterium]|nr:prolyl oligopeptidase family serine peptidase [Actinomycetota bacterium]